MRPQGRPTRRPENIPPMNGSSPARSKDEEHRRMAGRTRGPPPQKVLDIFADPPTDINRKLRRNSDSSVVEHRPMTEEDRKHREQRQREREARHKRQGSKDRPGTSGGPRKPSRRLDIIDKLDVTSIYGTECKARSLNRTLFNPNFFQCSTMMVHSTRATHTETGKALNGLPCELSPRIH
jgi:hypothetical protein